MTQINTQTLIMRLREMEINQTEEKCRHSGCKCPQTPAGHYCSDYCKNSEGGTDIICECGHQECNK